MRRRWSVGKKKGETGGKKRNGSSKVFGVEEDKR